MLEELNDSINRALKVDNKTNLTLPLEEWTVRSYDEVTGYAGRSRKPMTDWITEYNYVTAQDLTKEQFEALLQEKYPGQIVGVVYEPKKYRLAYRNGEVFYRYVQKTAMF